MTISLVTGGAGFIGSHLVDALCARGDRVIVVDNLSTGREVNLSGAFEAGAELEILDITDAAALARLLAAHRPDRVFHLAAQVDVRKAVADPVADAAANIVGTINLLEAIIAAEGPPAPVVFASTGGAIYGEGEGQDLPLDESTARRPETPYGTSKLCGEEYLALYRRLHGVPAVATRLGNVYGPRQDPHGEAGVVAIFCGRLLESTAPTVFGDGLQTRDYVYVGDVVRAMVAASQRLGVVGIEETEPFNVGTGVETTVLDLIAALAPHAEGRFEAEHAPARAGEVQRIALDAGRARRVLDWAPQVGVAEGLLRTLQSVETERVGA